MFAETPIDELKELAKENTDAQLELGLRYLDGNGIDKDEEKGRKHLSESAKAGNVAAQEALADYYMAKKSENWETFINHYYRKAITGGSITAPSKLADYYYLGDGNSNKNAALLYLESAKRNEDCCEREISILTRMLESSWLDGEWAFFAEIVEVLADNGNREAKHMIRREEVPEPTDDFTLESLLSEEITLPEETVPEKKVLRRFGRTAGKRALTSVLYDMGIEFTKTSNGIIKTKKGREIEADIQKLIERGYKFKYSYKSDKWTTVDKPKE